MDVFHFEYLKDRTIKDKTYWFCRQCKTSLKCKSKAISKARPDGTEVVLKTTNHSHLPDPTERRVKSLYQDILKTAKEHPEIRTAELVTKWCTETNDPAARGQAIKLASVERAIRKQRSLACSWAGLPNDPTFSDLDELPDFATVTNSGDRFLLSNISLDSGSRIITFASSHGLKLLSKAERWSGDGTFDKAPSPFYQIYSLVAVVEGKSYPALFAFLPDKKGPTYKTFITDVKVKLDEYLEHLGDERPFPLKQFGIDFESSFIKEFRGVFGKQIQISGCWNHYKRNLWSYARSLPFLQSHFIHSEAFSIYLKGYGALAFVPLQELEFYYKVLQGELLNEVLEELKAHKLENLDDPDVVEEIETIKASINRFIAYFENCYVGEETRTGRTSPRFPPEIWSQSANVVSGQATTTNANEALHSNMQDLIPPHSSIWKVVKYLKDQETKVCIRRDEFIVYQQGERASRDQAQKDSQFELKNLIEHRDDYKAGDFLRRLGSIKDFSK